MTFSLAYCRRFSKRVFDGFPSFNGKKMTEKLRKNSKAVKVL